MYPVLLDGVFVSRLGLNQAVIPDPEYALIDCHLKAVALTGLPLDLGEPTVLDSSYMFKKIHEDGFRAALNQLDITIHLKPDTNLDDSNLLKTVLAARLQSDWVSDAFPAANPTLDGNSDSREAFRAALLYDSPEHPGTNLDDDDEMFDGLIALNRFLTSKRNGPCSLKVQKYGTINTSFECELAGIGRRLVSPQCKNANAVLQCAGELITSAITALNKETGKQVNRSTIRDAIRSLVMDKNGNVDSSAGSAAVWAVLAAHWAYNRVIVSSWDGGRVEPLIADFVLAQNSSHDEMLEPFLEAVAGSGQTKMNINIEAEVDNTMTRALNDVTWSEIASVLTTDGEKLRRAARSTSTPGAHNAVQNARRIIANKLGIQVTERKVAGLIHLAFVWGNTLVPIAEEWIKAMGWPPVPVTLACQAIRAGLFAGHNNAPRVAHLVAPKLSMRMQGRILHAIQAATPK